jgi:hypothetical protein
LYTIPQIQKAEKKDGTEKKRGTEQNLRRFERHNSTMHILNREP